MMMQIHFTSTIHARSSIISKQVVQHNHAMSTMSFAGQDICLPLRLNLLFLSVVGRLKVNKLLSLQAEIPLIQDVRCQEIASRIFAIVALICLSMHISLE